MDLSTIMQIALPVSSADRSLAFYRDQLGLSFLFRFGELVFFDCGGIRLMLEGQPQKKVEPSAACVYFKVNGIEAMHAELSARGVAFEDQPHMIAKMPDHELWLSHFRDPDRHLWAIMEEKR